MRASDAAGSRRKQSHPGCHASLCPRAGGSVRSHALRLHRPPSPGAAAVLGHYKAREWTGDVVTGRCCVLRCPQTHSRLSRSKPLSLETRSTPEGGLWGRGQEGLIHRYRAHADSKKTCKAMCDPQEKTPDSTQKGAQCQRTIWVTCH